MAKSGQKCLFSPIFWNNLLILFHFLGVGGKDSYQVFSDTYKNFTPDNKFLQEKLQNIHAKAAKKKRLNTIEETIADHQLDIEEFPDFRDKEAQSNRIVSVESRIKYFTNELKNRLNYKEYNQEIREVQNLKKLSAEHRRSKSEYLQRLKAIKKALYDESNPEKRHMEAKQLKVEAESLNTNFEELLGFLRKKKSGGVSIKVANLKYKNDIDEKSQKYKFKNMMNGLGYRRFRDTDEMIRMKQQLTLPNCFRRRKRRKRKREGESRRVRGSGYLLGGAPKSGRAGGRKNAVDEVVEGRIVGLTSPRQYQGEDDEVLVEVGEEGLASKGLQRIMSGKSEISSGGFRKH